MSVIKDPNWGGYTMLEAYISSEGNYYPEDYIDYQISGPLDVLCPLCKEYNENYRQIMMGPQGKQVPVHVCENCAFEIDIMHSYKEGTDELYEDIMLRGNDSVEARLDTLRRLEAYKTTGELPDDIYNFRNSWLSCWACRGAVDSSNCLEIPIPVHGESMVNGGHVCTCENCADRLNWTEHPHDIEDRCPRCKDRYPISNEEADQRALKDTFGQHLCPHCFKIVHGDTIRYKDHNCAGCSQSFVIDLSRHFEGKPIPEVGSCMSPATCSFRNSDGIDEQLNLFNYHVIYYSIISKRHRLLLIKKDSNQRFWSIEGQYRQTPTEPWSVVFFEADVAKDVYDATWRGLTIFTEQFKLKSHEIN